MSKPKRGTLAFEIYKWLDTIHQQNNSLSHQTMETKAKKLVPFVKTFVEECGGKIPAHLLPPVKCVECGKPFVPNLIHGECIDFN